VVCYHGWVAIEHLELDSRSANSPKLQIVSSCSKFACLAFDERPARKLQIHSTRQPTSHFVAIRSIQKDERSCSPVRPRFDPVAAPGRLLRQSPENNRASVRTSRIGLAHENGNFCRPPMCGLHQAPMRVEEQILSRAKPFLRCSEFCCPKSSEIQPHQLSSTSIMDHDNWDVKS
jgi:hypothetical protein